MAAKIRELRAAESELADLEALLADPATDARCGRWPRTRCRRSRERIEALRATSSCCSCPRTRPTTGAPSSKSAPAPAATRRRSSPAISSACTSATPRSHGWKVEVLSASEGEVGGYKEIIATVSRQGRLRAAEVRIRRAPRAARAGDRGERPHPHLGRDRRGAAGGRGRRHRRSGRTTSASTRRAPRAPAASTPTPPNSAVRILHIPTGIIVTAGREVAAPEPRRAPCRCCAPGSTTWSGSKAADERAATRKGQVGSGDRSERIRTYNFPQGAGDRPPHQPDALQARQGAARRALDEVVDALIADDQARLLADAGAEG